MLAFLESHFSFVSTVLNKPYLIPYLPLPAGSPGAAILRGSISEYRTKSATTKLE
jgi:hypothetical protein